MSLVVPFDKCIARPDSPDGKKHLLREHLSYVACRVGNLYGSFNEQLWFLGGLCHDTGKARASWQNYICNLDKVRQKISHSPFGSALFSYCADKLLKTWQLDSDAKEELQMSIVQIARDIYEHHSRLADISREPPWIDTFTEEQLEEVDLVGLLEFVSAKWNNLELSLLELRRWLESAPDIWKRWAALLNDSITHELNLSRNRYRIAASCVLRKDTARLIAADRFHAGNMERSNLPHQAASSALSAFKKFCTSRAQELLERRPESRPMVEKRQQIQEGAYYNYKHADDAHFYSLLLPTGTGKTLTALRIALSAVESRRCSRIIYVAPYLSILSQATNEIRNATGLEVMQHHHLSCLEIEDDAQYLALDSWQSPIVTTTFNQLFRALFPARAQHTLRLEAFDRAFLIIDEPQIIDTNVWNLLLHALQSAVEIYNMQALFSTATLPSFEMGLSKPVISLAPDYKIPYRYNVTFQQEPLDEDALCDLVLSRLQTSKKVAVVLNTVRDAVDVFEKLDKASESDKAFSDVARFNLNGCMTPIHKNWVIASVKKELDKESKRMLVVSTQIIEAGVDLSFEAIYRATPIIPSIAQVAGRANRHGEGKVAEVFIFPFHREGKTDTRKYVYKLSEARQETDRLLKEYSTWGEPDTTQIVTEYYKRMLLERNTNTALLSKLEKAAIGKWSQLSGIQPYGNDYPTVSVFTPQPTSWLPNYLHSLLNRFCPEGQSQIYECYLDRAFMAQLSFLERKKFMALLLHFVAPLDQKTAGKVAAVDSEHRIAPIIDSNYYSGKTGLGQWRGADDFELCAL